MANTRAHWIFPNKKMIFLLCHINLITVDAAMVCRVSAGGA